MNKNKGTKLVLIMWQLERPTNSFKNFLFLDFLYIHRTTYFFQATYFSLGINNDFAKGVMFWSTLIGHKK